MEVSIDIPIIVNLAGGKGGVGTSTITANMAYVLGSAGSGYGLIGVIDVAYGANSTLSKLFGIPPLATNGFWNYITGKYYPYTDSNVNINPEHHEQLLIIPSGTIEAHRIEWALSFILAKAGNDPDKVGWMLHNDVAELILNRLARYGVSLVIIDIPATVFKPLVWAILMLARVVNVIVKAGAAHQDEAIEVLNFVRAVMNQRAQLKLGQPSVYLIVNQAFPNDNTASELKARGIPVTGTFVLPYSPAVHYITDYMKDIAVKYDVNDKYFKQWKDGIVGIATSEYEVARAVKRPIWRRF